MESIYLKKNELYYIRTDLKEKPDKNTLYDKDKTCRIILKWQQWYHYCMNTVAAIFGSLFSYFFGSLFFLGYFLKAHSLLFIITFLVDE